MQECRPIPQVCQVVRTRLKVPQPRTGSRKKAAVKWTIGDDHVDIQEGGKLAIGDNPKLDENHLVVVR